MGFFRIKNETDALNEWNACRAQIDALRDRYLTNERETSWNFLTFFSMKLNERAHGIDPKQSHADRCIKKMLASFEPDAKKLFKLQDRLANAQAYLLTHGYEIVSNGYRSVEIVKKGN